MNIVRKPTTQMIASLLLHEGVVDGAFDDPSFPFRRIWAEEDPLQPVHMAIAAMVGRVCAAAIFLQSLSGNCLAFHGAVHPDFRKNGDSRELALTLMRDAEVAYPHTTKLVTFTPSSNAAARHLMRLCGMRREGRITNAYSKGGQLTDLIIFSREVV